MEGYTITQVAELLSIKVHTIRYWEKNIPILTEVKRDEFGKRIYNKKDIFILMRLKHFTEERQFTLKGAAEELEKELSNTQEGIDLSTNASELKNIIQKLEHQKSVLKTAREILAVEMYDEIEHSTSEKDLSSLDTTQREKESLS